MLARFRFALASMALFAAAGCAGGSTVLAPHAGATGSLLGSLTVKLPAAQVNASLQSVETQYQTLPHTDVASDLQALANWMVSSGAFKTADVTPGGIDGTLPDGSEALVFADRDGDLQNGASASALRRATAARSPRLTPAAAGVRSAHEVDFLVNDFADGNGNIDPEFHPQRQRDFAQAFTAAGIPANALSISLENIEALGTVDFLSLSTHGQPFRGHSGVYTDYALYSTTEISDQTVQTYAAEDSGPNATVIYSIRMLAQINARQLPLFPTFAFTPAFLLAHVRFNPGAILDNQSCYGLAHWADPGTPSGTPFQAALKSAQIGQYLGWGGKVPGDAADQTDAFIVDRLLGSANPLLAPYVNQRMPAQRPFALVDTEAAMLAESRSGPLFTDPESYRDVSDNSHMYVDDFGGAAQPGRPIEYGLPSIAQLQVTEGPTKGTLAIIGQFPATPGTVQITDGTGTHALTPTSWTAGRITADLPARGAGSAGNVQVFDVNGIAGNAVPLTQWSGQFVATENDQIPDMAGNAGTGSGRIVTSFDVLFRSDVHPTVPAIDASPVPQNLSFTNVEGGSTAAVTTYAGSFISNANVNGSPATANFSVSPGAPAMNAATPPLQAPAFAFGSVAGQPVTCNNGLPGPQPGATNVFCPGISFVSAGASLCTDNQNGTLCGFNNSPAGLFSDAQTGDGLLLLTMDPATYAITVSASPASATSKHFSGTGRPATGTMTGTVAAAAFPPGSATAASRPGARPIGR